MTTDRPEGVSHKYNFRDEIVRDVAQMSLTNQAIFVLAMRKYCPKEGVEAFKRELKASKH